MIDSQMDNCHAAPATNYVSKSDKDKNHRLAIEKEYKSILQ